MTVSMNDLEKTASLAHLNLTEHNKEAYLTQFNDILNQVDTLNQLDLDNITPLTTVIEQTHYQRDDTPVKPPDLLLEQNAPQWQENAFRVPRILKR